jgi:hypothetical protein
VFRLDDFIRAPIKPLQLIGAGTFPLYDQHERIAVSEK